MKGCLWLQVRGEPRWQEAELRKNGGLSLHFPSFSRILELVSLVIGTFKKNFSYLVQQGRFHLENFEGPLELLLYLVQRGELELKRLALRNLAEQLEQRLDLLDLDESAESLGLLSILLVLKSRRLLPQTAELIAEEEGLHLELMEALLEYQRYRQMGRTLGEYEERSRSCFARPAYVSEKRALPLAPLALGDLAEALSGVLRRRASAPLPPVIPQELWQVSTKMEELLSALACGPVHLGELFEPEKSREERIAFFLALLELLKGQRGQLTHQEGEIYLYV